VTKTPTNSGNRRGWLFLGLAVLIAGVAWIIPARWRSLHPAVVKAAGRGTPGLIEVALTVAGQQRGGIAERLNQAATALELPRTNEVTSALEALNAPRGVPSAVRVLGGPDAAVAALLPPLDEPPDSRRMSTLDVFLPAAHRTTLKARLGESRSPGVQLVLQSSKMATQQFIPVDQPGGQPLEAVVLLAATLYERERLTATFSRELRDLAEKAPTDPAAAQRLENFYLNLLSLARRLDWTSLVELTRSMPGISAFDQFAESARAYPDDLPLLYAAALLSGDAAGVGRHRTIHGPLGRQGLAQAVQNGAGAVALVSRSGLTVRSGLPSPGFLAQAVLQYPLSWAFGRTELFLMAGAMAALSLGAFARAGVPSTSASSVMGTAPLVLIAFLLGGFLIIASEPIPARLRPTPNPQIYLNLRTLTKSSGVANSSHSRKNIMEPTTLVTVLIFGAIQLAVYVICVRKISEITRLPEPPAVRLRLLENEENLFDSGLYVGIGGTAAALVMQVLQMVEANLLAAYSSNLMGIICVAMVKIGHVRKARRKLILESQPGAEAATSAIAPTVPPAPNSPSAPSPVTAANPFTFR
jgi:hypothetical protein